MKYLISALLAFIFTQTRAQISINKLVKNHYKALEAYQTFDNDNEDMKLEMIGKISFGQLKGIPFKVIYGEKKSRMEMEIMGMKMIQISNDTLSWTNTPYDNNYTFERVDEGFDPMGFELDKAFDIKSLIDEAKWEPLEVVEITLDTLDVYELKMKTRASELNNIGSDLDYSFFFDKQTFFMVGAKHDGIYSISLDYTVVEDFILPKIILSLGTEDADMRVDVEEYKLLNDIDQSIFEMTQEVKLLYDKHLFKQDSLRNLPAPTQALYDEGVALMDEEDYENAIKSFTDALKINANDIVVIDKRGMAKMYSGDYYGAISDFTRALDLADSSEIADIHNHLGMTKYYLGDYNGAKKDYEIALSLDSLDAGFNQNMGLLMFRFKDYEAVQKYYSRAIDRDSTLAKPYYYRAVAKAELQKYEEAIKDYSKAEEQGLDAPELFNYRGVSEYNLGDFEAASISVQKALKRDSTNDQYIYNQAEIYEQLDDYQSAIKQYDILISHDSTYHAVYSDRALAYWELSLMKAARRDIDKAIEISPETALYYDYRAYMKEEAGDYTGAIEDFTSSLNLEQDAQIYYRRGMAKINISNKFDACNDFKKAADLGNENGKAAISEYCKL